MPNAGATETPLKSGENEDRHTSTPTTAAQPANHSPELERQLAEQCEKCKGWCVVSDGGGIIEAFDGTNRVGVSAFQDRAKAIGDGHFLRDTSEPKPCKKCKGKGRKADPLELAILELEVAEKLAEYKEAKKR